MFPGRRTSKAELIRSNANDVAIFLVQAMEVMNSRSPNYFKYIRPIARSILQWSRESAEWMKKDIVNIDVQLPRNSLDTLSPVLKDANCPTRMSAENSKERGPKGKAEAIENMFPK